MTAQAPSAVKESVLKHLRDKVVPELERLVETLPEDLTRFDQAESQIRTAMLGAARLLLEGWAEHADPKVARPTCPGCKVPMRHKGHVATKVVSLVGAIDYRRPRWRCEDCGQECYPHDAALRFGNHGVSWNLARVCGRLAADIPSFQTARETLEEDYGVHLATETFRQITEEAGQQIIAQEDERRQAVAERRVPLPESEEKPDKAYLYADGTMIHSEGDWHEIRVNTVRTEDASGGQRRCHSQARFLSPDEIGWLLVLMARSVGYQNARLQVFIADGAIWLWRIQEQYFGGAIAILDWYHLAEKVHAAANGCFGDGSEAAKTWAEDRKTELWEGRSPQALEEVRALETRTRSPTKRAAVHALRTYLENQAGHLDYPRYRELGLMVGSGPVEAQCKTLVGGRCKQAGMRDWTYPGAEGVLRLRAARQDCSFDALWAKRLRIAA